MLVKVIYLRAQMVVVAQLVRAPDCGSGGRGFESVFIFKVGIAFQGLFMFFAQLVNPCSITVHALYAQKKPFKWKGFCCLSFHHVL